MTTLASAPSPTVWQQLARRQDASRPRPAASHGIQAFNVSTAGSGAYVLVRGPGGRAFLCLAPWQYALLQAMDGSRTMRDLLLVHLERSGVFQPAAVAALLAHLYGQGLVASPGDDCYDALAHCLRSPRRSFPRPARRSWETPAALRLLTRLCGPVALPAATRAGRWAALLLGLAGLLLPVVAVVARGATLGADPSTPAICALALWVAATLYVSGCCVGCLVVRRPPSRAGIRLLAGFPVPWLDGRESLIAGIAGARVVWLAGPLALLVAAAIGGAVALLRPAEHAALAAALAWLLPALWLLAPASAPAEVDLAALPAVPALRRASWWRRPWRPRPPLPSHLPDLLWACALLALLGTLWHAGLAGFLAAPWRTTSIVPAVVASALLVYLAACAAARIAPLPVQGRSRPAGGRRRRARTPAAHIRRRLAALERCDSAAMLTDEQRRALAERAEEVTYPSGFDVVVQGEAGDDYYIVMEGTAEAIDEGGPTLLQRYGPGGSFGTYALIYHALRAATVRAATDLRLLRIDRPTFDLFLAPRLILQERLAALADERRILAGIPLFATLSPQDLDLLLPRLIAERYDPGAVIIRQGERGEHFYIVKSGAVEVIDEGQTPPRRLNVLGHGDYFGEIALLLDRARIATVRALVEVGVWRLSRTDFDLVLGRYLGLETVLAGTGEARLAANLGEG